MPNPLAIVTSIYEIIADPADPLNKTQYTVVVKLLFCGPEPLEQQCIASIANAATKAQIKSAINNVIIAAVASHGGGSITAQRILTIADIAG